MMEINGKMVHRTVRGMQQATYEMMFKRLLVHESIVLENKAIKKLNSKD